VSPENRRIALSFWNCHVLVVHLLRSNHGSRVGVLQSLLQAEYEAYNGIPSCYILTKFLVLSPFCSPSALSISTADILCTCSGLPHNDLHSLVSRIRTLTWLRRHVYTAYVSTDMRRAIRASVALPRGIHSTSTSQLVHSCTLQHRRDCNSRTPSVSAMTGCFFLCILTENCGQSGWLSVHLRQWQVEIESGPCWRYCQHCCCDPSWKAL